MKELIRDAKPKGSHIRTKLAIDGASAANKKRRQMESGTVELLLPEYDLSRLKSSKNCHQLFLYFGKEDAETLIDQLYH